jgi:hypothetical protein
VHQVGEGLPSRLIHCIDIENLYDNARHQCVKNPAIDLITRERSKYERGFNVSTSVIA